MKRRHVILIQAAGIALLGAAYLAVKPASPQGNFPARFSNSEKLQIESAIRRERYGRCARYLMDGEISAAWRWLQRSKAQTVWDVGDQGDGGIWLHVGINEVGNQKSLTGRFIMRNESGRWKIVASNL